MMQKLYWMVAGALVLLLPYHAQAQAAARADSAALSATVAAATQQYIRAVQPESVLFDGAEYVNYLSPGTKGHQFFVGTEPQLGTIEYRGAAFQQVSLNYDLILDQVIMYYPGKAVTVKLLPEEIPFFTLGSHRFVRLAADSTAKVSLEPGFYELLAAGPVSLLARHTKKVHQTIVSQNLTLEVRQTDKVFAKTATETAEITNLKGLIALLPAHQADVQRYARLQNLRFGPAQREASALATLRYYYTLAH